MAENGYYVGGNPSGYRGTIPPVSGLISGVPPGFDGRGTTPPPDLHAREATFQELIQALARAFGPGCAVGAEAFAQMLTRTLVAELRNTQIGSRLGGHLYPPPRAFATTPVTSGIEVAIPLPPVGPAGAFTPVLDITLPAGRLGAMSHFGHALSDVTFFGVVEHKLTVDGVARTWFGQIGTLEAPLDIRGTALQLGGQFLYEARNISLAPGAPNVMAAAHGWHFSPPAGHYEAGKNWQPYMVDGG
jgi:hypothetical protein